MRTVFCTFFLVFCLVAYSHSNKGTSNLKVCNLFSNHMVLQQQAKVNFWGHGDPGQEITISTSWGIKVSTNVNPEGLWKTILNTPKAGGGSSNIKIISKDSTIVISDILIGEVWLASGQSNMDISLSGWLPNDTILNSKVEIANANFPDIRFLKVQYKISCMPIDSADGKWIVATPKTAGNFSATAYFYAKKLHQELNVPIGIIQSAIGGTPAEAWTSAGYLSKMGDFDNTINGLAKLQETGDKWYKRWPTQKVPATIDQWQNIDLGDMMATEPGFNDVDWTEIKLPGRFDALHPGEFDGALWLRNKFEIKDISNDHTLKIGGMDDLAIVFINGHKIGIFAGGGFPAITEILIPKDILIKGINSIAIRAIDTGGPGSIGGPMTISDKSGNVVSIEGKWKSRLIAENFEGKIYTYSLLEGISERPDMSQLNSNTPSVLFNAMINPLIPYTIKGVIWYQGESNVGRADQYKRIFPNMIADWRNKWGYELPFYFVQIAPYLYTDGKQKEQSPKLRNAQRLALKVPKTGMVVTLDYGCLSSAHPAYKQIVGDRLARFALVNEYGRKMVTSGPLYKNVKISGNNIEVEFESGSIGSGLKASDKGLSGFEIAGADKIFVKAQAIIKSDKVVLSNSAVVSPVYVRYAWNDGFAATLFNKEGLPASTFTSEE